VHSVIPVEELRELSDKDVDIVWLGQDMEVNISEALWISLEEVWAHYFVASEVDDK
jgi:hypothetical protein